MMSEQKLFWSTWFMRITLLFGILVFLFLGYVSSFVDPNLMESYTFITSALIGSILFFSTFPGYRLDIRFNQLKKQLSDRHGFNHTSTAGASKKNGVRFLIEHTTILLITLAAMIFNFVLGWFAHLNGNNSRLFIHMVFVTTIFFVFNAFLLVSRVDETFKKLEGFIFQLKTNQAKEEKSK